MTGNISGLALFINMHLFKNYRCFKSELLIKITILVALLNFLPSWANAQKALILTDADIGKSISTSYNFKNKGSSYTLSVNNRFESDAPMSIMLVKDEQVKNGPVNLNQNLPAVLYKGKSIDLTFTPNYLKSINAENHVWLIVFPQGSTNPKDEGVVIDLKFTAEGHMMFWNDYKKEYSFSLPDFNYKSADEKIIELSWNGSGSGEAVFSIENDAAGRFELIPNVSGSTPLTSGTKISLSKGGSPFFVRYKGGKLSDPSGARLVFTNSANPSEKIGVNLTVGNPPVIASNNTKVDVKDSGTKVDVKDSGNKTDVKNNTTDTNSKLDVKGDQDGKVDVKGNDTKVNTIANNEQPVKEQAPVINEQPVVSNEKPKGSQGQSSQEPKVNDELAMVDAEAAKAILQGYYDRKKDENAMKIGSVNFTKESGYFVTRIPVKIDSLIKDKHFRLTPIWVSIITENDSVSLPGTNFEYSQDSLKLKVTLSGDAEDAVNGVDSFQVVAGFLPEYMSGKLPVNMDDQSLIFTGKTYAKVIDESNWLIFLYAGAGLFVFLFFFLGRIWVRRPVKSFRYLRESRYQRERYKYGEGEDISIDPVFIDLSRQDTDLIQLSFNFQKEGESGQRTKSIDANVPSPKRGGLKKFFAWFYGLFGMRKDPRFKAVYYSLRIEQQQGAIPQHLKLKDDHGLILLGTTLTSNVLATDHQDFSFTKSPFGFSLYIDPAEILDYSGSMKTVSIPFKVVEEPFEGYVMTREMNVEIEIASRY